MYFNFRIRFANYFFHGFLVVLCIFLFKIQIIDGAHYRSRSENNRIRLIPIKTTRGRVFDSQGLLLADNKASFTLQLIPQDFPKEKIKDLAKILGVDSKTLQDRIESRKTPSFVPITIKRDLSADIVHVLEEHIVHFPGLSVEITGKRYYPQGSVAAHVIGYLGKISRDEYDIRKHMGYLMDDYVGRSGIEYLFEEVLRGVHGGKQVEVDARGREKREIAHKPPFPGDDITLTLDIELQKKIQDAVGDDVASVCLMDVKTGEILTLLSTPTFDPNAFVTPSRSGERLELFKDKGLPFLNRAISSRYPPGSVFKIVTALAGLESGKITPNTTFTCTGAYKINEKSRAFHCWSRYGHGDVNLAKALERSCNVYFYKLGKLLGVDIISDFCKKIRLGEPVNIELRGEASGIIPSREWKKDRFNEKWYQGETLIYAIGQGYLSITPLQVMRLIAIIANDGKIVEPTIIQGVKHDEQELGINKYHVQAVKKGMLRAVQMRYGTAHMAQLDFMKIAAKTGTAQNSGEPHSWFAGFFPFYNPRIAIAVVVEHGGHGGGKAAAIAKEAASSWYELKEKRDE